MQAAVDFEKSFERPKVTPLILACVIFFGTGWGFVKVMNAANYPPARAIESSEETIPKSELPADLPMFKSGNISSVTETKEGVAYTIVFSLGSIEQIKGFYKQEMPANGWSKFVGGTDFMIFTKRDGKQKAVMSFTYYAGKVKLRTIISGG